LDDLRDLQWDYLLAHARKGVFAPLADELRKPEQSEVPREVRSFLANAVEGRRPRGKPGLKQRVDPHNVQMYYLGLRLTQRARTFALEETVRHFGLSRATIYEIIRPVRQAGDVLAKSPR
jgi:hypothetical protein